MRGVRRILVVTGFVLALPPVPAWSSVEQGDRDLEALVVEEAFHVPDRQFAELAAIMLAESPELRSARAAWRSHLDRVPQERSLPDPQVGVRYFIDGPETRVGPGRFGIELSQGLPWNGKRALQARRAGHEATRQAWDVRAFERSAVAALKHAYFESAYLQEALKVNSEETALLKRFEQIALTRYATGKGIQQSVIKLQTDISRLADQETALRERLDASARTMARLSGRPEQELDIDTISLSLIDVSLDPEGFEEESVRNHPAVRARHERIDAEQASVRRRILDSRPDFHVGIGYMNVGRREDLAGVINPPEGNGMDDWSVSLGVNLPLYRQRIRSGVSEARERVASEEQMLDAERDRLRFDIQESILRLRSIRQRARLYRDVIVPQAEESLASAEAAYTTNRQDLLDLLDAERVLFQVRLTYHRLLSDYWIALADLELGLGRRFPTGAGHDQ